MSDDAPLEPVAPEPVTEPMETVPVATDPGPPVWPAAGPQPTGAPSGAPPPRSSTVAVPKWVLIVVAAVVGAFIFGLIGFGIGYAVGDDGGNDRATSRPVPGFGNGQFGNGFGTRPGNGNGSSGDGSSGDGSSGGTLTPRPDGAFLGVATEASTDPDGARVARVVPDSPASDGGLKVDDVITKVDDDSVSGPEQLAARISAHDRGDEVTITYVRDGDTDTTKVTLASRSSIAPSTPSTTNPGF